jgi:hypothetical protein
MWNYVIFSRHEINALKKAKIQKEVLEINRRFGRSMAMVLRSLQFNFGLKHRLHEIFDQ